MKREPQQFQFTPYAIHFFQNVEFRQTFLDKYSAINRACTPLDSNFHPKWHAIDFFPLSRAKKKHMRTESDRRSHTNDAHGTRQRMNTNCVFYGISMFREWNMRGAGAADCEEIRSEKIVSKNLENMKASNFPIKMHAKMCVIWVLSPSRMRCPNITQAFCPHHIVCVYVTNDLWCQSMYFHHIFCAMLLRTVSVRALRQRPKLWWPTCIFAHSVHVLRAIHRWGKNWP